MTIFQTNEHPTLNLTGALRMSLAVTVDEVLNSIGSFVDR
jgi:hypothetical protein